MKKLLMIIFVLVASAVYGQTQKDNFPFLTQALENFNKQSTPTPVVNQDYRKLNLPEVQTFDNYRSPVTNVITNTITNNNYLDYVYKNYIKNSVPREITDTQLQYNIMANPPKLSSEIITLDRFGNIIKR